VAHYVSIRGWLECTDVSVDIVHKAQLRAHQAVSLAFLDQANQYAEGWQYPTATPDRSAYIFFGASIHDAMTHWFRNQLEAMIRAEPNLSGLFWLDGDHYNHTWHIENGTINEHERRTSDAGADPEEEGP
jgi:hypothetical protein